MACFFGLETNYRSQNGTILEDPGKRPGGQGRELEQLVCP